MLDKAREFTGPDTAPEDVTDHLLAENRKLSEADRVAGDRLWEFASQVIAERDERASNGNSTIESFTAESLMAMDFPEIIWVVPELLPTGAALLAGKPKFGKSWLALGLCAAVGYGGKALSTWDESPPVC